MSKSMLLQMLYINVGTQGRWGLSCMASRRSGTSWRHQMLAVAKAGYRAIAPDWRGYGLSQQSPMHEWSKQSLADLEDDLLAVLDTLDIPKVIPTA